MVLHDADPNPNGDFPVLYSFSITMVMHYGDPNPNGDFPVLYSFSIIMVIMVIMVIQFLMMTFRYFTVLVSCLLVTGIFLHLF